MELKKLLSQFVYRIEPKPEGGFIARPSDPGAPVLEAPTREELQGKIQASIATSLGAQFPGLNLPQNQQVNLSFHIEHKADGTFDIHSGDPSSASIQGVTGDEVESHFAEKLVNLVGKHLAPEFSQALGTQLASGNVKIFINKTTKQVSVNVNGSSLSQGSDATPVRVVVSSSSPTSNNGSLNDSNTFINAGNSSPITPGGQSSGAVLRFIITALIVIAAMYAYVHFYH